MGLVHIATSSGVSTGGFSVHGRGRDLVVVPAGTGQAGVVPNVASSFVGKIAAPCTRRLDARRP